MAAKNKEKNIKRVDPISERARALNEQISTLEAEIKKLDSQLQRPPPPKLRSTTIPHGVTIFRQAAPMPSKASVIEPVFEEVKPLEPCAEAESSDRFNELGVRKYDLPALWNRLRNYFRGPTTSNPRLVNYLAAGGVHGLRPLRYEKRVARNRFIIFTLLLLAILFGLLYVYIHSR